MRLLRNVKSNAIVYALIVSLCMNIAYKQRLGAIEARLATAPQPGGVLQLQRLQTRDGRIIDLADAASGVPTILYYFSPSCGWCERNWSSVSVLEKETRGRYRFIALAETSDLRATRATHNLEFDVVGGLKASDRQALGFMGTPQTVVISPEGRVLRTWTGAYGARVREEVEAYFNVGLPPVTPRGNAQVVER